MRIIRKGRRLVRRTRRVVWGTIAAALAVIGAGG